ncbi:MAG: HIT family protein [Candidatus Bathyarchaeota archaeon]|nr:HIT family protein [Candidatus Bathyarchaeota archaeon]
MTQLSENCIFCKIIQRDAPADFVYEDDGVVAFLSNRPVNQGHTLVVPKRHYENIHDIPEDEAAYLFKIAKRLAGAVRDAFGAAGVRLVQNSGEAAGQVVFHLHVHVIPMYQRNVGSHDGAFRDHTSMRDPESLELDAKKLRRHIV